MGGRTSHTAILAQALGLPGVVGLHDFSQRVRPGDPIVIDGESGDVVWLPSDDERKRLAKVLDVEPDELHFELRE